MATNADEVQKRIDECRTTKSTKLDLSNLALTTIPAAVFTLTHLTELLLGDRYNRDSPTANQLTELPPAIGKLQQLRSLDLRNNQLSTLPEAITHLQLRELYLRNNQLSTLPEAITQLQQLQTLWLENNQLSTLPEAITQLQQLQTLYLGNNQLSTLPEAITQLRQLQRLDLNNNQLSTLPETITQLQQLQRLYLNNNQLSTLPEAITQLHNLQGLYLSGNQLSTLPEAITQLQSLQELNLNNNQLSTLPEAITQLQQLRSLDLSNNQLSTLPEAITQLQQLQTLYLRNNQLSTLPEAITQLQQLRSLDLSNNQLSTLPEAITQLQQLQTLYLSNNQLSTLPEAITQLQQLKELYLSNNQLSTLPEAITQLQQLKELNLSANPLLNPPLEVASRGIEAIRTYFANFGEIDHLYEAKLLLVGEGDVGKTSLKKKLINPAAGLTAEKSTKGIDIQRWVIPGAALGLEKDFTFNIWDFGGQDIYHHIHQFFLTRRSLYLLLTEARKEDQREDFYWWLNIVRLLGDRSPVILVLNKIDVRLKELPVNQLRTDFPNLVDYQRISCAPDYAYTIEALKEAIVRQLRERRRMGHVAAPLPAAWVVIRQAIEAWRIAGHAYMSNGEYLALCQTHQLDETIANVLSDYFHDLGVFLHFRDDLRLNQTIFLDHKWVTDAVYKVLDYPQVIAHYGEFTDRDLMDIWGDPQYREKQAELLALMMNEKFEICYQLPGGRGYLAPQRLPEDAPTDLLAHWRSDKENLHFEYRYTFMPKGILSRFIVKRHQDIYQVQRGQAAPQGLHWRQGVLLEWGATRALVREEYFERKLTIVLEGGNKKGFLDIVRKTVEEIHASFNNLAVQEMIPCNCEQCRHNQHPHFYRYEILERFRRAGKREMTCEKSVQEVNIQGLINDVFLPPKREGEEDEERRREILAHGGTYVDRRIVNNSGSVTIADVGEDAQNVVVGAENRQTATTDVSNQSITELTMPKSPKSKTTKPVNNAWINGSFYLVATVVVLALIAYISKQVPWYALPIVLIAGLLVIGVVGALQLKNDDQLKDESFVQLMIETYKRLPLLKNQSR